MGRAEKPVDRTVASRGDLAELLRTERARAGLTYAELAAKAGVSAATLKRAASGTVVPSADTVERYLGACGSNPMALTRCDSLRRMARRDEQGGHTRISPEMLTSPHELAQALKALHVNAGAPLYREMQRSAGGEHLLPLATISRILNSKTLPADERQMSAFLAACRVMPYEQQQWMYAWARAAGRPMPYWGPMGGPMYPGPMGGPTPYWGPSGGPMGRPMGGPMYPGPMGGPSGAGFSGAPLVDSGGSVVGVVGRPKGQRHHGTMAAPPASDHRGTLVGGYGSPPVSGVAVSAGDGVTNYDGGYAVPNYDSYPDVYANEYQYRC